MLNRFWIAAMFLLSPAIANAWEEQQALEFILAHSPVLRVPPRFRFMPSSA